MKSTKHIRREIKSVIRREYSATDLANLIDTGPGARAPNTCVVRIFMRVPGGGDWSNMDLEVGEKRDRLIVEVTRTEIEETEE